MRACLHECTHASTHTYTCTHTHAHADVLTCMYARVRMHGGQDKDKILYLTLVIYTNGISVYKMKNTKYTDKYKNEKTLRTN